MVTALTSTLDILGRIGAYRRVGWGEWGIESDLPLASLGYGSHGIAVLYTPRETALGHYLPCSPQAPGEFLRDIEGWIARQDSGVRALMTGTPSAVDELTHAFEQMGLDPRPLPDYAERNGQADLVAVPGKVLFLVTAGKVSEYDLD